MKWLAPSAPSCDPARMRRDWASLVNSPSISHARAPHGCPLGASCTSLPDCTIKPRQLPKEPRWLLAMSVQCQVADILVRASFKENEEGYKKTGREDVELEHVMMSLMNTASLITKFSLLLGGEMKDRGLWNWGELGSDLCETYPCHRAAREGRGEEVPPGTSRLYFFWPPCQPRLNVYTGSSSLLLLHCCLRASIPQGLGEGEGGWKRGRWRGGIKSWTGKDKKRDIKWQQVREREKEAKRELHRVPQA